MGRSDYLALGDWNAICDRCGRKFKASQLFRTWDGLMCCKVYGCWEPRQPQDFARGIADNMTAPWQRSPPTDTFVGVGPVFVGAGPVVTGSTLNFVAPQNMVAGNLVVLVCLLPNLTSNPSGYSSAGITGGPPKLQVMYKLSAAAREQPSIDSQPATASGVMLVYSASSGFDLKGNIATGSPSASTPAITTTADGDLVISIFSSTNTAAPTLTGTFPTTVSPRVSFRTTGFFPLTIVDEIKSTAGATTPRTIRTSAGTAGAAVVSFKF